MNGGAEDVSKRAITTTKRLANLQRGSFSTDEPSSHGIGGRHG